MVVVRWVVISISQSGRNDYFSNSKKWESRETRTTLPDQKLHGKRSKLVHLQGVPHGGVISPTLLIIFINDLTSQLSPFIHQAFHVVYLAIWTRAEYTTTAAIRLQEATNTVSNWAKNGGVEINKNKTATTLFSLSTMAEKYKILLEDTCLPQNDTSTYLGITFDRRFTWVPHIENRKKHFSN